MHVGGGRGRLKDDFCVHGHAMHGASQILLLLP